MAATEQAESLVQVPSALSSFNKPAAEYLASTDTKGIDGICVGGVIFATSSAECVLRNNQDYVLLVKRAADGGPMDNLWETPGGACEDEDSSIIQSCSREILEETGLHAAQANAMLGSYSFKTRSGKQVLKLNFEIQVKEAPNINISLRDMRIRLDPKEHVQFAWASFRQIEADEFPMTSKQQKDVIITGFKMRREGRKARQYDIWLNSKSRRS